MGFDCYHNFYKNYRPLIKKLFIIKFKSKSLELFALISLVLEWCLYCNIDPKKRPKNHNQSHSEVRRHPLATSKTPICHHSSLFGWLLHRHYSSVPLQYRLVLKSDHHCKVQIIILLDNWSCMISSHTNYVLGVFITQRSKLIHQDSHHCIYLL